ncbi:MAG: hypothetical protein RMJ34_07370 [candidate division WOR-3 bacterium]|nr:hypothetical protein [candidate division WOR-3 bacterium]
MMKTVFDLTIDNPTLIQGKQLNNLFILSTFFYNACLKRGNFFKLSPEDIPYDKINYKGKTIKINFKKLNLGIKYAIIKRLRMSVLALSKLKKQGFKVGKIKPKNKISSVPLSGYPVYFGLDRAGKLLKIKDVGEFKVNGIEKIPYDFEVCFAVLKKTSNRYSLKVLMQKKSEISTTYQKNKLFKNSLIFQ